MGYHLHRRGRRLGLIRQFANLYVMKKTLNFSDPDYGISYSNQESISPGSIVRSFCFLVLTKIGSHATGGQVKQTLSWDTYGLPSNLQPWR